ncbi:uncharacterized protein LOC123310702 [Coccinella septempunctata]|uniref:uncharacterized protein LOC123310702 n=1 Tax=Coccinella septempunctata TaxID=41139 RepID=UPI001D087AC0|nr:uncharacterized protein LOC123310702 [Coccinella septempunctata]
MGIWYAKRCEPVVQGSVINLSNDCIQFIETGKAPRKTVLKKNFPLEEEKYFTTMRAIDDAHSRSSGVNFESFKKMANSLEATLTSNKTVPCAKRRLLNCLRDNEFCMIKCRKELEKFIDCVDALRVEVMKKKYMNGTKEEHSKKSDLGEGSKCPGPKKKIYLSD